jgi:hypothetical protein
MKFVVLQLNSAGLKIFMHNKLPTAAVHSYGKK